MFHKYQMIIKDNITGRILTYKCIIHIQSIRRIVFGFNQDFTQVAKNSYDGPKANIYVFVLMLL
jgi:hypothetical protein